MTTTTALFNSIEVAQLYARHRDEVDEQFIDRIASVLGPAGRLLDIGGGCGGPAAALKRRGFDPLACEPSPAMIATGRARHPEIGYIRAYGEDIPLGDTTFDAATIMYVLHHAENPEAVLAEARRVVRPDGRIVGVSGTEACARQRFFGHYFPTLRPDLPDADEIGIYARAAGLKVVESHTVDHWVYPNRTVDAAYVDMVSTEMFSSLGALNPDEYDSGVRRLRHDIGQPIPPSEASLLVLARAL